MITLATAFALSDRELLAHIGALIGREREATAELVAHLAALEMRPNLYAAQGYASLFTYCTEALGLSEDATCNRIEAARASIRFPVIVDLLASGSITLTAVRLLKRHLTPENHEAVLASAARASKEKIELLIAALAPKPDVPTSVRKLPAVKTAGPVWEMSINLSRHIPVAVKRAVWWRDAGQCAFTSEAGHRCTERSFLELHHIRPYALDGPATVNNISLRCRRHNQYEGEVVFGLRTSPRPPVCLLRSDDSSPLVEEAT